MMYCKVLNIIYIFQIILPVTSLPMDVKAPELFNKDAKMDKLVLKNQIGFHFRKVVREVSQELFVSRKIDISSLFLGIQVLEHTQHSLDRFCQSLEYRPASQVLAPTVAPAIAAVPVAQVRPAKYMFIPNPVMATFAEARARCEARGMQLPEVYTNEQRTELSEYLKKIDVKQCFAGLVADPVDSITRFIATGFPIWRSGINEIYKYEDNKPIDMMITMDNLHAKYLYTSVGTLMVSTDEPSAVTKKMYGSHSYRDDNKDLAQTISRIVCETKWDGTTYVHYLTDRSGISSLKVHNRYLHQRHQRAVMQTDASPDESTVKIPEQVVIQQIAQVNNSHPKFKRAAMRTHVISKGQQEIDNLKELCAGIVSLAEESHKDASSKLTNLLSSVDISVHLEKDFGRQKRVPIFLAKMIFTTGVKLIWNLFSFVQQTRADNRVKDLQKAVAATGDLAKANGNAIKEMSEILYGQSIAIQKLTIKADNLDQRLSTVEDKVVTLESRADKTENKLETALVLQQIENLIIRVRQSHNDGYDTLEDIIHCSLLGQTSPQILPVRQMEIVQNEVRKVSTAVLDPDYAKMQSIVVSDPADPHLLLIVVNMAAMDRRNLELVNLIPVPYFEYDKAHIPVLDYTTIVLDQLSATYSVLNSQEETSCLTNRCYVSSVERQTTEKSCGIPQLYDRHSDACIFDDFPSTGIFLKPVLPDGIIFSLRDEVDAQLFCKDNTDIRSPKKLKGTGVLQLPNGCMLSVTDKQGRNTKVKGQPVFRMIDAEDLELAANGPLGSITSIAGKNRTHKLAAYETMLSEHYSSVIRQVETVDVRITSHNHHIWGLTGSVLFVLLLTLVSFLVAYKYSRRFRKKINHVRTVITEITQQIVHLQASPPFVSLRRHLLPPIIPPKPVGVLMRDLLRRRDEREKAESERQKSHNSEYGNSSQFPSQLNAEEENIYQAPSSFGAKRRPASQGLYPDVPRDPDDIGWSQSANNIRNKDSAPIHRFSTLQRK